MGIHNIEDSSGGVLDPTCELFRQGDPEFRNISQLSRVWLPAAGAIMGVSMVVLNNAFNRRPFFSGKTQNSDFET